MNSENTACRERVGFLLNYVDEILGSKLDQARELVMKHGEWEAALDQIVYCVHQEGLKISSEAFREILILHEMSGCASELAVSDVNNLLSGSVVD